MIISNVFAIVMITLIAIFPLFLILNYPCRKARIHEEEFKNKYGDLYSDFNLDHKRVNLNLVLLYPFIFVAKRLILALECLLLNEYVTL